mmetsp:Transcript_56640/g.64922  ORF Transcript_56640/g.64922 Transcript_56640/m.64922 type:complete len:399 (-) Transcript_56640:61-1257(-)
MFRVKSMGSAASTMPLNSRLLHHIQGYINLQANGLAFEMHDAVELAVATAERGWNPAQLSVGSPKQHFFCSAAFAKEVLSASVADFQVPTPLSIPKYLLDPLSADDMVPRSFLHHSQLLCIKPFEDLVRPGGEGSPVVKTKFGDKPRFPAPRCGLTGLFYSREDVVDNLIQASIALQFNSQFWIPQDHPQLGNFLKLKEGAAPIALPLFARVAPIDVVKVVPQPLVYEPLKVVSSSTFHTANKARTSPYQNANVQTGVNIFTGKPSVNRYLCGDSAASRQQSGKKQLQPTSHDFIDHPVLKARGVPVNNRGIWISLGQFVRNGLTLRDELQLQSSASSNQKAAAHGDAELVAYMKHLLNIFLPIEEKQLIVYNGDQLVTPGRLALKSSPDIADNRLFK